MNKINKRDSFVVAAVVLGLVAFLIALKMPDHITVGLVFVSTALACVAFAFFCKTPKPQPEFFVLTGGKNSTTRVVINRKAMDAFKEKDLESLSGIEQAFWRYYVDHKNFDSSFDIDADKGMTQEEICASMLNIAFYLEWNVRIPVVRKTSVWLI